MTWEFTKKRGTIELRNTFASQPHYANVLIVVDADGGVVVSMNGKAPMTVEDINDMNDAVKNAQTILGKRTTPR